MTNGVTYKHFFNPNVAIIADMGIGINYTTYSVSRQTISFGTWDFRVDANAVYQDSFASDFYWFAGGGTSIGEANAFEWNRCFGGVWGLNAIGGVGYELKSFPLTFDIDFRPGLGVYFAEENAMAGFDWRFNFSVRYRF